MKIKNIFLQKNFLIPAILLVVIASVATIVVLSSDSLDSNLLKNKQVAQVGSTCIPIPGVIIQNGNFEQLTEFAVGPTYSLSQASMFNLQKEVCFFEGSISVNVLDEIGSNPASNNILQLRYVRHAGEGQVDSVWFNGHRSLGVVQNIGEITPGVYNVTFRARTQAQGPLVLYVGFSDGPVLRNAITSQASCTLQTSSFPDSTVHDTKYNQFETCVLGQFEAYTQITIPAGGNIQTYSQTITIGQSGLDHIYILPFGPDPEWTVLPGVTPKPAGVLIVDDLKIEGVCSAPVIAPTTSLYGPMYYNQGGQSVSWGVGNFIGLSQADSTPLSWTQYNLLSNSTGGQGVVFQRPTENTFVVTPLSPYTNYTLQDIYQMFNFVGVSITGMDVVYNNNGPFVSLDTILRKNLFTRIFLPQHVFANIDIPHYVVTYECGGGLANNSSSSENTPIDISVIKSFLDNTTSSTDRQIKYLVQIKNNSSTSGATGVIVKDLLPSGIVYTSHVIDGAAGSSYNPTTGIVSIPFLGSNDTVSLTITATASNTACGSKTNTATLQSLNQTDSNPSNNSSSATLSVVCLTVKNPTGKDLIKLK